MSDAAPSPPPPTAPLPRRRLVDGSLLFLMAFALASAAGCYFINGPEAFVQALDDEVGLVLSVLPTITGAVLLAACLQVLLPIEAIKRQLGQDSGWRGLLLATTIGLFVPGGPMASFPLMLAVMGAGADVAASVAFLTSWSVLGLQRVIVWEIPLMGGDFALIRFLASLPLPIIAAFSAVWLLRRLGQPRGDRP